MGISRFRLIPALVALLISFKVEHSHGAMTVSVVTPGGHGSLYPGDTIPYTVAFNTSRDHVPSAPLYVVLVPVPDPGNPGAARPIFPWSLTLTNRTTSDFSRKIPSDLNVFGNFTVDIHSGKDVYGPLLAYSDPFTISPLPFYRKILEAPFIIQTTWGTYLKFMIIYWALFFIYVRWRRRHLKRKATRVIGQAIARARAQGRAEAQQSRGELLPVPTFLSGRIDRAQARTFPRQHTDDVEAALPREDAHDVNVVSDASTLVPPLIDLRVDAPSEIPVLTPAANKKDERLGSALSEGNETSASTLTSLLAYDPHCEPLAGMSVGGPGRATLPSSSTAPNSAHEGTSGLGQNALAARVQELTNTVEQLQALLAIQSGTSGEQVGVLSGPQEEGDQIPPPTYAEALH